MMLSEIRIRETLAEDHREWVYILTFTLGIVGYYLLLLPWISKAFNRFHAKPRRR